VPSIDGGAARSRLRQGTLIHWGLPSVLHFPRIPEFGEERLQQIAASILEHPTSHVGMVVQG